MPKPKNEELTSIEDFANAWGVSTKTVQNWVEFTYHLATVPVTILRRSMTSPMWFQRYKMSMASGMLQRKKY